jgi:hypothetical protein
MSQPPSVPPQFGQPLSYATPRPAVPNQNNLDLLRFLHYGLGILAMIFANIFIVHIVLGWGITHYRVTTNNLFPQPTPSFTFTYPGRPVISSGPVFPPPPAQFGWLLVVFGALSVLLGWTWGILLIVSGRCIARRRHRVFSMVIAGLSCLQIPFGTALGVFTMIELSKDSVRAQYDLTARGQKVQV